jgi:two-component system OmpR family response regulator
LARSLDVGADAHLLNPYTPQSFLSQLCALLRRVGLARSSLTGRFDVGTLAIDVFSREVRVRGQPVELTPMEFEVLRCLLNNSGRALSYRSLMRQAHGYDCS